MTIWRGVAGWISKATHAQAHVRSHAPTPTHTRARACTHTHTQKCLILIAFPWQKWFRERASMLVVRTLPILFCSSV